MFIGSVPQEDPSGHSMVIPRPEYERIRSAARMLTPEQKAGQVDQMKKLKETLQVWQWLAFIMFIATIP